MSRTTFNSPAAGTGTFTVQPPEVNNNQTLTLPDMTGSLMADVLMTQQTAATTAVDFTAIPTTVSRITVMFANISLSGTANLLIQLGDSGGLEITGYSGASALAGTSVDGGAASSTAGFIIRAGLAAGVTTGAVTLTRMDGNTWVAHGSYARTDSPFSGATAGVKTLSAPLDRVRFTTTNGTDTFDAGTVNILYEG